MKERLLLVLEWLLTGILMAIAAAILLPLMFAYAFICIVVTAVTFPAVIIELIVAGLVWLFTGYEWLTYSKPADSRTYTGIPHLWMWERLQNLDLLNIS